MESEPGQPVEDEVPLPSLSLLVRQTLLVLVAMGVAAFVLFKLFGPHLVAFGHAVEDRLGLPGAFAFVYVLDTFVMPLSADVLFTSAGAWDPVPFILTISLASILGGITGYWLSRTASTIPLFRRMVEGYRRVGAALINKYGIVAVIIAALTPVPFSAVTWVCGFLRMKFGLYIIGALFRLPRMLVYWWVIQLGMDLAGT